MFRFYLENARWISAGFLLTFMSAFGQTYFIALFSGEIRAELHLSHGEFGTIYGVATLASAIALIWVGKLADVANLAIVGVVVSIMLGGATLAMAVVSGPANLLLAIFALRLFGQGMMTHVSQTAMGRWFAANRGRALALSGFGFPASEAFFPAIVVGLIIGFGWRGVWFASAVVLFLISAPGLWFLLRQCRVPRKRAAECGPTHADTRQWTRPEVLHDRLFYILLPGVLAPSFIGTGILFHQVHLVESKGWALAWFAAAFPLYAGVSVVASLIAGLAIDRWSAVRVLPYMLLPLALASFVLAGGAAPFTIIMFMTLMGMTAGMQATVVAALWPEIYGVRHLGAIRSVAMSAMVLSSAGSPFVLGAMIDDGISFDHQLSVMGVYLVLATSILLYASRRLLARAGEGSAPVTPKPL